MATQCPNLRAFALTNTLLSQQGTVEGVVDVCPHIEHLDLGYNNCLSDNTVLHAARRLKLKSLCVDDSMLLTDGPLHELQQLLGPTLNTLYINNCPGWDPLSIVALVRSCPHLHTLSIGGDDECSDIFRPRFLRPLSTCAPALRTLLLDGEDLANKQLDTVAEFFPHLEHFGALSRKNIKKGLTLVVKSCTALKSLTIFDLQEQSFRNLWLSMNPRLIICYLDKKYTNCHHYDILAVEV